MKAYDALAEFSARFHAVHVSLSITICCIGTVCNLCNILVLTRRSMRTAVNTILCGIASCDCVVMLSNLVFITHFNLVASSCHPAAWNRNWALFTYAHAQLSLIGHSSSIWLSVAMGWLRYATLASTAAGVVRARKPQAEMRAAYLSIVAVLLAVALADIPNCLSYSIARLPLGSPSLCPCLVAGHVWSLGRDGV